MTRSDGTGADDGAARRMRLGGTPADGWDLAGLTSGVADRLAGPAGRPLVVASTNLDHLHHFGRGGAHAGLVERAEETADWLVLLDGMPLVWRAARLTGRRWERLTGADLLPELLTVAASAGSRVGFLGGREETHRLLAARLAEQWPDLKVGGYWAPSRARLTAPGGSAELAAQVREAVVDLLVVGLGKPRQEAWLAEHAGPSGIKVGLAVGAAADFLAGVVDRAPDRWRDSGLEWLYRLLLEPRRLSRRYLLQGPRAAWRLLLHSTAGVGTRGSGR